MSDEIEKNWEELSHDELDTIIASIKFNNYSGNLDDDGNFDALDSE